MKTLQFIICALGVSALLCFTLFAYQVGAREPKRPAGCAPGAAIDASGAPTSGCYQSGRAVCFEKLCCYGGEKRTNAKGEWFYRCKAKPRAK